MPTLTDRIGKTYGSPLAYQRAIPYIDIPAKLRNREPFRGNSMHAQLEADGAYVVYSYATVIATVDPDGHATVIDRNRWRQTTGRHINLCRAHLS